MFAPAEEQAEQKNDKQNAKIIEKHFKEDEIRNARDRERERQRVGAKVREKTTSYNNFVLCN